MRTLTLARTMFGHGDAKHLRRVGCEGGEEGRATTPAAKHSVTNKSLFICAVLDPFVIFVCSLRSFLCVVFLVFLVFLAMCSLLRHAIGRVPKERLAGIGGPT